MRRNKICFLLFVVTAFLLGCGSSKQVATIDEMPEFPGGWEMLEIYLLQNIHYPEAAQRAGVEGKVMVQFFVETDGSITESNVVQRLSKECDEEALRVVNAMPRWKPGRNEGQPVRVSFLLPIRFKLPGEKELLRPGGRGEY